MELLSSIAQLFPARMQPPAEQPAAPGGGAGNGGAGRESTRSRTRAHPASRLTYPGTGTLARRGTICSADASKTGNRPGKLWGEVSTFPLPGAAQAPGIPRLGVPGATWAVAGLHAAPLLAILIPPGSAVLQLELGSDAAGCAAPRPALPASPNQPLSKGWSSKIFSRAPSVYHTVNLGFQQLYDAAGRWEREQNAALLRQTQPACASAPSAGAARGRAPSPACRGGEDRSRGYGWVRAPPDTGQGGCWYPRVVTALLWSKGSCVLVGRRRCKGVKRASGIGSAEIGQPPSPGHGPRARWGLPAAGLGCGTLALVKERPSPSPSSSPSPTPRLPAGPCRDCKTSGEGRKP